MHSPDSLTSASLQQLLTAMRDARFSGGIHCPRCGHDRVHRWGTFSGRQRYRCQGCRRTFSDFTGTPAAYLKKVELLPAYGRCLAAALSVRRTAAVLAIDPTTAFRWRHRILYGLAPLDDERLKGWVEIGCCWFAESFKGQRRPLRPQRPHPRRYRVLPGEGRSVAVTVACDRLGHVVTVRGERVTSEPIAPSAGALEEGLARRIRLPSHLIPSPQLLGACRGVAPRIGAKCHRGALHPVGLGLCGAQKGGRLPSLFHVGTVSRYVKRLRGWLAPFRGVSTHYLANYLLWHRHVDSLFRHGMESVVLRWPATV